MSKILAIDPGNEYSAYVTYFRETGRIAEFAKCTNEHLLGRMWKFRQECDCMAIEMPACYGMAVGQSVFDTCRFVGIFQGAFSTSSGKRNHLVYRKARNKEDGIEGVCMHICKNNKANDSNIRQAIIDLYGGKDKAIGNKKCPKCKGKGWFGTGRLVCPVCDGKKWKLPPGPLCGIAEDVWAALAVAITFSETYSKKT